MSLLSKGLFNGLVVLVTLFSVVRCSDANEQYGSQTPPIVDWSKHSAPSSNTVLSPTLVALVESDKGDDKARQNSLKPILYGIGAAGISFKTEFKDGQALLSKPTGSASSASLVQIAYPEQVIINWRKDAPRIPEMFLILTGYQGELEIGGRFGKVRMGSDFSKYFTADDEKGEKLIRELYRTLEKIEDPNFDCLTKGLCLIEPDEKDVVLSWSKMSFLISKDRKILYRCLLTNPIKKGKLDNSIDLADGKVVISNELGEEQVAEEKLSFFKVGENWGSLKAKVGITRETDAPTSATPDSFIKDFDGIRVVLTKAKFDRSYIEADDSERLQALGYSIGFNKPFKINKQFVEIVTGADEKVEIKLVEKPAEKATLLTVGMGVPRKHQLATLTALQNALVAAFPKDLGVTFAKISGQHRTDEFRSFGSSIVHYEANDPAKQLAISFQIEENSEQLSNISVETFTNEFDALIVPTLNKTLDVTKDRALAGFTLGQTVQLKDIDEGRNEATVSWTAPDGKAYNTRSAYSAQMTLTRVANGKFQSVPVAGVSFGTLTVKLGLQPADSEKPGEYKVVLIQTASLEGAVTSLCGLPNLSLKLGTKDTEVKSAIDKELAEAVAAAKKKNEKFNCSLYPVADANGTGNTAAIYSGKEGAMLQFSDRALSTISIFELPKEVTK